MVKLDEIQTADFTVTRKSAGPTFLPEPERRPRKYTVISVDDHIVEPPDMFVGRVPAGPRRSCAAVVATAVGGESWVFDGDELPNVGFNAVAGRPVSEYSWEPARFDEMRRGAWNIDARVHDMDLNGIYASVNFPSFLAGFSGYRLQLDHDADLALAVVRAWNDYHLEVWAGTHPGRIIPLQLPWLLDPEVAAQEIRRNAERGFRAVSFTESPDKMDLPSLYSDHWDPFFRACEETETVLCMHFGSSGTTPTASDGAPPEAVTVLFGVNLDGRRRLAVRQDPAAVPGHQALPVGGRHRLGPCVARPARPHAQVRGDVRHVRRQRVDADRARATELLVLRHRRAVRHRDAPPDRHRATSSSSRTIPHADSTWPDTQAVLDRALATVPPDEAARITWKNASELFRHPVPAAVQADPEAF